MAVQIKLDAVLDLEMGPHVVELRHEELGRPELRRFAGKTVILVRRSDAAKLVIEYDRDPARQCCEVRERKHVLVRDPGPAWSATSGRTPDSRSRKTLYPVWNISLPTTKSIVPTVGSVMVRTQGVSKL